MEWENEPEEEENNVHHLGGLPPEVRLWLITFLTYWVVCLVPMCLFNTNCLFCTGLGESFGMAGK